MHLNTKKKKKKRQSFLYLLVCMKNGLEYLMILRPILCCSRSPLSTSLPSSVLYIQWLRGEFAQKHFQYDWRLLFSIPSLEARDQWQQRGLVQPATQQHPEASLSGTHLACRTQLGALRNQTQLRWVNDLDREKQNACTWKFWPKRKSKVEYVKRWASPYNLHVSINPLSYPIPLIRRAFPYQPNDCV